MCALSPTTMSAHEDEEKGSVVGEDDDDEEEEEEAERVNMKDSAQLAPTHFNVSITTSGAACEHKEIDRGKPRNWVVRDEFILFHGMSSPDKLL